MCLSEIVSFTVPKNSRFYKCMRKEHGSYKGTCYGNEAMRIGEWYDAILTTPALYTLGFHCFLNKESAFNWAPKDESLHYNYRVVEVELDNIHTTGYEDIEMTRAELKIFKHVRCVVASRMKIIREVGV